MGWWRRERLSPLIGEEEEEEEEEAEDAE